MKDLSIIIVNYNVQHFLEQCLRSVRVALEGLDGEIIVVDNHSQDGSVEMVKEKFAEEVVLIENQGNPGFSKANNQGIARAQGRYILLLNPDTVVEEHTFHTCVQFMDAHEEAGALGVKMIDGDGQFLPESKRALPTPWVSFYKIFGLAALFPRNKRFGQYHLTYLSPEEKHEIEILSGAFMFLRKSLLDQIGGLDEQFFMYGEDIDLSYRVLLANRKNYYLADARIIHYKGESTKKGSLNYVRVFYQAMIIFAQKHFGGSQKRWFELAIHLAVYVRALMAVAHRLVRRWGFPLLEGGLIYSIMYGIKAYWEHYVKYIVGGSYYPPEFARVYLPAYAGVFVGFLMLLGAYRRPYRLRPLLMAPFLGFVAIATVTYLFPFVLNFSRAIVGLSAVFTVLLAMGTRSLIHRWTQGSLFFTETPQRRTLLVGNAAGVQHIQSLLQNTPKTQLEVVGYVSEQPPSATQLLPYLGSIQHLPEICRALQVQEVMFAQQDLSTARILSALEALKDVPVEKKIAPAGMDVIIGPKQVLGPGRQEAQAFHLATPKNQGLKRGVDLLLTLALLLSFPLLAWAYGRPMKALGALWQGLLGKKRLVGYASNEPSKGLPELPPASLSMLDLFSAAAQSGLSAENLDAYYARFWRWELDVEVVWKAWRKVGTGP